jgi:hypothetical protein
MSIIKVLLGTTVSLTAMMGAIAPASAQWVNRNPWGSHHHSGNVVVGDRVYLGPPSSVLINGHRGYDYHQPTTVIIIQQAPSYYSYPTSTCTTSIVGSPIPLPYARDSRTGALCQ